MEEKQRLAALAEPRGTPGAVEVLLGVLRQVVLHDPVDAVQVESARCDVGRDHDPRAEITEADEGLRAVALAHLAVQPQHRVAHEGRDERETVGALRRAGLLATLSLALTSDAVVSTVSPLLPNAVLAVLAVILIGLGGAVRGPTAGALARSGVPGRDRCRVQLGPFSCRREKLIAAARRGAREQQRRPRLGGRVAARVRRASGAARRKRRGAKGGVWQ